MKEATILKKIEELESERESLFAQKAPIEERLVESYYELEKLYEARDKAILKRNRKEIDIDLILTAEHQSMVMYREAEKQIQKLGLWGGRLLSCNRTGMYKVNDEPYKSYTNLRIRKVSFTSYETMD